VVEWFRVDDIVRAQIRERGSAAIQPVVPLIEAARELVKCGVTDGREIQRLLGT
jgi:hypothetical protein